MGHENRGAEPGNLYTDNPEPSAAGCGNTGPAAVGFKREGSDNQPHHYGLEGPGDDRTATACKTGGFGDVLDAKVSGVRPRRPNQSYLKDDIRDWKRKESAGGRIFRVG